MYYLIILLTLFSVAHARPHGHACPTPRAPVRSTPAKTTHSTPVKPEAPHVPTATPPVQKSSWMPAFLMGLFAGHHINHHDAKKENKDEEKKS